MICYNSKRNELYCAVCGKGMILPKEATHYSFGLAEEDMRQLHKGCKYISPDKPYPDPEPIKESSTKNIPSVEIKPAPDVLPEMKPEVKPFQQVLDEIQKEGDRSIFVSRIMTVIAIIILIAVFCFMVAILYKQPSRQPQERKHQPISLTIPRPSPTFCSPGKTFEGFHVLPLISSVVPGKVRVVSEIACAAPGTWHVFPEPLIDLEDNLYFRAMDFRWAAEQLKALSGFSFHKRPTQITNHQVSLQSVYHPRAESFQRNKRHSTIFPKVFKTVRRVKK